MTKTTSSSGGGPSRRDLLAAGAGAAALAAGGAAALSGARPAAAQPASASSWASAVPRRRSIYDLTTAEIDSLRRGVSVMKSRPFSDPTSWAYQASIHGLGFSAPAGLPAQMAAVLDQCVHGSDISGRHFFLPWHRLYLHFFERILRAASGDSALTLPYWDYDSPGRSALPGPFHTPGNTANALFEPLRDPRVNAGTPLAVLAGPGALSTRGALGQPIFDWFSPAVEISPHNAVHVLVGGLMGSVGTSANDPIFWLHHCNVDRLWARWRADTPGAVNPINDQTWMDQTYSFYDENRILQTRRVSDALRTTPLGYIYDDVLSPTPVLRPMVVASLGGAESGMAAEAPVLASAGGVTLGALPVSARAAPKGGAESGGAETPKPFETDPTDGRRLVMRLKDLSQADAPGVVYGVFLNLPAGAAPDQRGPHFAGVLAPFAFGKKRTNEIAMDISGVINLQIEEGLYKGGEIKVDFIPLNPPEAAAGGAESGVAPENPPLVKIGSISFERR